jgi:predicted DNA-binding protein (MmcQ/YjbR family)
MDLGRLATELRAVALGYPETYEEQPWGDRVVKVKGKIFFSCGVHEKLLYATVKLPQSGRAVLQRDDAEPTHYGMGKYGWVTLKFATVKAVPVAEIKGWIHESFLAVAPKRIVKGLERDKTAPKGQKKAIQPQAQKALPRSPGKSVAGRPRGAALLVCADKLRAGRALAALAAAGVKCAAVPSLELARLGKTRALIVDLGRNPREGLALAEALDESDHAVHLFVVGVRDAEQARRLRRLGSAETFRAPPGDGAVVAAVAAALAAR